jgi:hypothetical protein
VAVEAGALGKAQADAPRVFISYSWTSPQHQKWVLDLADQLAQSGVDVLLDKWDLREGADKYAYMERMVTDPSVNKVVMICDRLYAEKADGREGGVGTETQIISPELYEQTDPAGREQKFVALIVEKSADGEPYVPVFCRSRIYIDMASPAAYTDGMEQLLRWIFDKPLLVRPQLGKPPAFIMASSGLQLPTTQAFRHASQALSTGSARALDAVSDYLDTLVRSLETLKLRIADDAEPDEATIESISAFRPYRDEAVEVICSLVRKYPDPEITDLLHRFLEGFPPYWHWPQEERTWNELAADNYRFIGHEMFLYVAAALLKARRFSGFSELTERGYYLPAGYLGDECGLKPFTEFRPYIETLERRNARLNLRRVSLHADLLKERSSARDLRFEDLMQADFTLFVRRELMTPAEGHTLGRSWWPATLVYAGIRRNPFEVFARAESRRYFADLAAALGIQGKEALLALAEEWQSGRRQLPRWHHITLDPIALMGLSVIGTGS